MSQVKAGCEVLAGQARRAGQAAGATPVARLDTPAEHCAFFRGEEATHVSGPPPPPPPPYPGQGMCMFAAKGFCACRLSHSLAPNLFCAFDLPNVTCDVKSLMRHVLGACRAICHGVVRAGLIGAWPPSRVRPRVPGMS